MQIFEDRLFTTTGLLLFIGILIGMFLINDQYAVHADYGIAYRKKPKAERRVGWIACDLIHDDPNFVVCDENRIYDFPGRRARYRKGLHSIRAWWDQMYASQLNASNENGYVTIRFVINCEGWTGRFRVNQVDHHYQATQFSEPLNTTLLEFVKSLQQWLPGGYDDVNFDTYEFLNFKITNGRVTKILS